MKRIVILSWALLFAGLGRAAIPGAMNFQGRLVDGTNLVSGNVSLQLKVYDDATGGTLLYVDSNTVAVVDGMYSTLLGDDAGTFGDFDAALDSAELWVEAEVDGQVLSPRFQVSSAPYALRAADAEKFGGRLPSAYATGTPLYVESDPRWAAVSNDITAKAANGQAAYDWGNHADVGYLTDETDPVWTADKSLYATGTPVYAETDPLFSISVASAISAANTSQWSQAFGWGNHASAGYATAASLTTASNSLQSQVNTKLTSNTWAAADSTTNYVRRTGDIMTGALTINEGASSFLTISNVGSSIRIGGSASVAAQAVAVGVSANAGGSGVAVGYQANGNNGGVGVGRMADGNNFGTAAGSSANGASSGAALGYMANATNSGVAAGQEAVGAAGGVAAGYQANAQASGVALGYQAAGAGTNIAIGLKANATGGLDRIAIGRNVTNAMDNSAAVRGTLYLDGGTGIYYRATFGSGTWISLLTGLATGTPVYVETDPVWAAEKSGYATGTPLYVESDPLFSVSVASVISVVNTSQWSEAYGWGDHAAEGYLTSETDPVWAAEKSGYATGTPVYVETDPVWTAEKSNYATGTPLYVFTETDPLFSASVASAISAANTSQWSQAYGWGDHGEEGYLTAETDPVYAADKANIATGTPVYAETDPVWAAEKSQYATGTPVYAESDPIFAASVASAISAANTSQWSQAYGWGDHAGEGYLTSETDPVYSADKANIATGTPVYVESDPLAVLADGSRAMSGDLDMGGNSITNVANGSIQFADGTALSSAGVAIWNTAYGWGDHSAEGYLTSETDPVYSADKPNIATGTPVYAESDPIYSADKANIATGTPLYVESDPLFSASVASAISAANTSEWSQAYGWGNHATAGYATAAGLTAASNSLQTQINAKLDSNTWAAADSTTNFVKKTGDTMTGPLAINATVSNALVITNAGTDVAIGNSANGNDHAVAVGYHANGYHYGAAMGESAQGQFGGVGMGYQADGSEAAVAMGYQANGKYSGAALGPLASATYYGVAVGHYANGARTNVAVGAYASAQSGTERIAIGHNVTNAVNNSAALRGTLYLDGGTGVFYRATFGEGAWTDLLANVATGTPLYVESDPLAVLADGSRAMSGDLDMGGNSITNVADGSIQFADGTALSSTGVGNWNTAYGWGDHAAEGYITGADATNSFVQKASDTMTGPLTVENAIVVGSNTVAAAAGMIRFNPASTNFEGYTGSAWVSLTPRYAP